MYKPPKPLDLKVQKTSTAKQSVPYSPFICCLICLIRKPYPKQKTTLNFFQRGWLRQKENRKRMEEKRVGVQKHSITFSLLMLVAYCITLIYLKTSAFYLLPLNGKNEHGKSEKTIKIKCRTMMKKNWNENAHTHTHQIIFLIRQTEQCKMHAKKHEEEHVIIETFIQ